MLFAEIGVLVAILAAHLATKAKHARFFEERVKAQDEIEAERRKALYKIQKHTENEVLKQNTATRVLADEARHLHENIRLVHERVDRHFAHPGVKRILGEGDENG